MPQDLTAPASRPAQARPDRRERFSAIYDRYHLSVLRYAWRRAGPDQAEDIAHETFAVAWRRLEAIPPSGELPWLYKVAGNLIRNSGRRDGRDAAIIARLSVSPEPDHADAVSARQLAIQALRSLSPGQLELLRLVAWEGLDAGGAAAVLGCGRPAVYLRLHRLRKRLESLLELNPEKGDDQ
ncbi:MAG TPA: RNA polymerase sigma factor [Streptosporangiaceae bacterium]